MSVALRPASPARLTAEASRLAGTVHVPGDKSMSHRALILGALAEGTTRIEGLLESDDVMRTLAAVRAFGATVDRGPGGAWLVSGARWRAPLTPINCGNSGTAARLLIGAAAGQGVTATFTGDGSLSRRPMDRVLDPLRDMGCIIDADQGLLPVTIRSGVTRGIAFHNRRASAQVKSAILLAGLGTAEPVAVAEDIPSRDHSERMLAAFGCDIEFERGRVALGPRRSLTAAAIAVPGDPSSAAFPVVATLLAPGSAIEVRSVVVNPLRTGVFDALGKMGADIGWLHPRIAGGEEVADLDARFAALSAIDLPASAAPSTIDEYPILAVAAAFATGTSIFRGLGELRHKECDRLAAIVAGLRACGVEARADGDDLIVEGRGGPPPGGAFVETQGDHRIAMSFLVLGLAAQAPVTIDRPDMIATSFPDFTGVMAALGARIA